jgi:serine/threonine protein kinase
MMNQLSKGAFLQGNKYRIERVLGQGGFGITYLATHTILDRKFAIKEFFPKDYCDRNDNTSHVTVGTKSNVEFVARLKAKFIKEARNISRLDHPSIVRIHDVFEEHDTAYYVMDFVDGESLSDMVKRRGPISRNEAVDIILKVGAALDYVHSFRMNHLDIKPANIMIRRNDSKPILIDFGLAKQYDRDGHQTSTTPVGISHGYAPMEQYKSNGVVEFSPQTDVYSLAATLYTVLTGVTPPDAMDLINTPLQFPGDLVPVELANVINKAMSPRKVDRYSSISEFCFAISNIKGEQNVPTRFNNNFAQNIGNNEETVVGDNEETVVGNENTIVDDEKATVDDNNINGIAAVPPVVPPPFNPDQESQKKRKRWKIFFAILVGAIVAFAFGYTIVYEWNKPDNSYYYNNYDDTNDIDELEAEYDDDSPAEAPAEDTVSVTFDKVDQQHGVYDENGRKGFNVKLEYTVSNMQDETVFALVSIYEKDNSTPVYNSDGVQFQYSSRWIDLPYDTTSVEATVFVPLEGLPVGNYTFDVAIMNVNSEYPIGNSVNHSFKIY